MGPKTTLKSQSHCQHTAALTQRWKIMKFKKMPVNTKWRRKYGGSLDFNVILSASPAADENRFS